MQESVFEDSIQPQCSFAHEASAQMDFIVSNSACKEQKQS